MNHQEHAEAATRLELAQATLVVLPGLDGGSTLREAFLASARQHFGAARVVAYPATQAQDYDALERFARAALPDSVPFVLVGESFSGPLALRIGAAPPPNLVGLVLSTTFAHAPLPLSSAIAPLARTAMRIANPGVLPASWWRWALLGGDAPDEAVADLRAAIALVDISVLRARAMATLTVDARDAMRRINLPVLCLRGTRDRLLRASTQAELAAGLHRCERVAIDGPHLLLQRQPQACAAAIARFAQNLTW